MAALRPAHREYVARSLAGGELWADGPFTDVSAADRPASTRRLRLPGVATAAREAVTFLTREGGAGEGFWIHLDADVLDDSIMWAVDDPRPNALLWDDLAVTLRTAVGSGRAVHLQVTIYNPIVENDGVSGRGLAAITRETLAEFLDV